MSGSSRARGILQQERIAILRAIWNRYMTGTFTTFDIHHTTDCMGIDVNPPCIGMTMRKYTNAGYIERVVDTKRKFPVGPATYRVTPSFASYAKMYAGDAGLDVEINDELPKKEIDSDIGLSRGMSYNMYLKKKSIFTQIILWLDETSPEYVYTIDVTSNHGWSHAQARGALEMLVNRGFMTRSEKKFRCEPGYLVYRYYPVIDTIHSKANSIREEYEKQSSKVSDV